MISVHHTTAGLRVGIDGAYFHAPELTIDDLFTANDAALVAREAATLRAEAPTLAELLPPVGNQEVWASGVTYLRSRDARMEESESSGANRLYDLVYEAPRPELFFKATPARVRGSGQPVRIRADGTWNVPEPELTLAVNAHGRIFGCTIGNDMSSRDIEGENPLYLPQAKIYRGSCAIGPALVIGHPLEKSTAIRLGIERGGDTVFSGETALSQIKRGFDELADWLFRENEFPHGAWLMTGTGIVPPSSFTLRSGDVIRIAIDGLGELLNTVE